MAISWRKNLVGGDWLYPLLGAAAIKIERPWAHALSFSQFSSLYLPQSVPAYQSGNKDLPLQSPTRIWEHTCSSSSFIIILILHRPKKWLPWARWCHGHTSEKVEVNRHQKLPRYRWRIPAECWSSSLRNCQTHPGRLVMFISTTRQELLLGCLVLVSQPVHQRNAVKLLMRRP